jgi:hypothetical protein
VTYFNPLFSAGLFGKANAAVCNAWTDAARFSTENQEPVRWAAAQAKRALVVARAVCKISAATSIGSNKWNYTIALWTPPGASGLTPNTSDQWFTSTTCKNLREQFNDATTVDGMDISSPPATVGPVGSVFTAGAWPVTNLNAVAEVSIIYDTAGKAYAYFDRPNPIRCS